MTKKVDEKNKFIADLSDKLFKRKHELADVESRIRRAISTG